MIKRSVVWMLVVIGLFSAALVPAEDAKKIYKLTPDDNGQVLQTPDGRIIFRYTTSKPKDSGLTANSVCCLYPVNTPEGERMVDYAPSDHRHHRGVFLAWHSMVGKNKADFWGWGAWAPTDGRIIKNQSVDLAEADANHALLKVKNDWMVQDETLIRETTTVAACQRAEVYVIDLDFQLTPTEDVTISKTAFGGFCLKCRKDGEAHYANPAGKVELPDPHFERPATDWPDADWYDYVIKLKDGKTAGIAAMNHPGNPPTAWHNPRSLAMLNPCIVAAGPVVMKQGQPLRLRYRLVVHDGPTPVPLLNKLSEEWRKDKN